MSECRKADEAVVVVKHSAKEDMVTYPRIKQSESAEEAKAESVKMKG